METLGRWWNGKPGRLTTRRIWLERLDDGRYQVRWRGEDWTDRDGRCWRVRREDADAVVAALMADELGGWRAEPLDG
jgi:hypothetical protein